MNEDLNASIGTITLNTFAVNERYRIKKTNEIIFIDKIDEYDGIIHFEIENRIDKNYLPVFYQNSDWAWGLEKVR